MPKPALLALTCSAMILFTGLQPQLHAQEASTLRIGIIGLDTSHSTAFTKLLNGDVKDTVFQGCRVVVACPRGSADIESSVSRIPGYTEEVAKLGVKIVNTVGEVVAECDAVLLETNDGRPHLEQVLPVLMAGKPVFIDKPIAGSLVDAVAIYEASRKFNTPLFSSSSLRYMTDAQKARAGDFGTVTGCDSYSPCSLEATHPSLFWYGIHGVETLFTVMGQECESVSRVSTPDFEHVSGTWKGGRIGTFRGIRAGKSGYGGTLYTDNAIQPLTGYGGYQPLLVEIIQFFRTKNVPVSEEETLAIYSFMEAADESQRRGGAIVSTSEVLAKARQEAATRLESLLK